MASLTSLNSYSSSNTVMTVNDQSAYATEGASVEMPLMAWLPIHDIGNTLVANGIAVTHRFHDPVFTLSDGTDLTQSEYNTWANIHLPALNYSDGTVVSSNAIVKYQSESMYYNGDWQYYTGTDSFISNGPFTIDGWFYPNAIYASTGTISLASIPCFFDHNGTMKLRYIKRNSNTSGSRTPLEDIWIEYDNSGSKRYYRIDLLTQGVSIYQQWAHLASVRFVFGYSPPDASMVVFVNGVKRQVDYYGTTFPSTYGSSISPPGPVTSNVAITDTATRSGNIQVGGGNFGSSRATVYIDQLRVSNVARYSISGFTPPTSSMSFDNNTIVLLQWDDTANAVVQVAEEHWPYLVSNPIVFPNVELNKLDGNPNITLTQDSANTWTISGIRTPEDYLQGAGFLNFPPDYYGNLGNANVNGTGTWTTNIRNTGVATYDYTYNVNLTLENTNEFSVTSLANIEYTNANTQVLSSTQVPLIADLENTGVYTLTVTTQSTPGQLQLSVGNVANLTTNTWGNSGANGQLTLSGTKDAINSALGNVSFTTSANATATLTAIATANSETQSESVFSTFGTQPNPYRTGSIGSLKFQDSGSGYSTAELETTSSSYATTIANWLGSSSNPTTIEFWAYDQTQGYTNSSRVIADIGYRSGSINTYLTTGYNSGSSQYLFGLVVNGTTVLSKVNSLGWHHHAFTRGSNSLRWFVDGTLVGSISYPTYDLLLNLPIFGNQSGTNGFIGYLSEVRISNSVRYVANFGTTALINRADANGYMRPLEVDDNTLALWRFDSATWPNFVTDNKYTLFDRGYLTWQSTNPNGLQSSIQGLYKYKDTP